MKKFVVLPPANFIIAFLLILLICQSDFTYGQQYPGSDSVQILFARHQYSKTVAILERVAGADSGNAAVFADLGLARQESNSPFEALSCYMAALKIKKNDSFLFCQVGRCLETLGARSEAMKAYRAGFEADSSQTQSAELLGELLVSDLQFGRAIPVFLWLAGSDSTNYYYLQQLGNCFYRSDSLTEAGTWYQKALQYNPRDLISARRLATISIKQGQFDTALAITDSVMKFFPDEPDLWVLYADILFKKKEFKAATEWYRRILESGDTTAANYQKYGLGIYFYASGNDSLNINKRLSFYLESKGALIKSFLKEEKNLITCLYLGIVCDRTGDWDEALQYCLAASALARHPLSSEIYIQLARVYATTKQFEKAHDSYLEALACKPGDPDILFALGNLADIDLKDKDLARKYFRMILEKDTGLSPSMKLDVESRLGK